MAKMKYFPHLAGSLILVSAATGVILHKWEPDKRKPEAHLYVYADKLASNTLTVCSGITQVMSSKKLVLGDKWTQEDCNRAEENALSKVQNNLAMCFTKLPPQSVFDSATSHAWNLGVQKACGSAAMKHWNQGNYKLGCQLIAFQYNGTTPNWSYSDGKFVQGLHNRRVDEMQTCLKDVK